MSKSNYFEQWLTEIREMEVIIGNLIGFVNGILSVNNGMDISLMENYIFAVKEHMLLVAELIDKVQSQGFKSSSTGMKHYIHPDDDIGRLNDEFMVANLISFMASTVLINFMSDDEKSLVGSAIRKHILDRSTFISNRRNPEKLEYQFDDMPDYIYYINGCNDVDRQTDEAIISNMNSVINDSFKQLFSDEEREELKKINKFSYV